MAAEASNSRHGMSRMAEVGQVEEEACRVVVEAEEEDCDARAVGGRKSDDMRTWPRWFLNNYER